MSEPEIARLRALLIAAETRAELAGKSVWGKWEPWLCLAAGFAVGLLIGHFA